MINFGKYNLIRLYNSLINIQLVMVGKRFSHRRRGGGGICGNFQHKKPFEILYIANTDVASIRFVFAENSANGGLGY